MTDARSPARPRHLVLVLGDQLDAEGAALDGFDPTQDLVWMAEVAEESTHIRSSKQRIVLFLAASAVTSTGVLSTHVLSGVKNAETILLGMGLVGLGSNVDLRKLRAVGGRPLGLALGSWALVAVVSLGAVKLSGL